MTDTTTTPGPRTEAGKRLLNEDSSQLMPAGLLLEDILAIEAEARADVDGLVALRPFAAFADPRRVVPADFVITQGSSMAKRQLTMGDCYAAADALISAGDKAEAPNFPVLDYPENGAVMDKAEASLLTVGIGDTLLVKLSEDDIMYDHPVSSMHEPADPVLFVRWDAILAVLHPNAEDKAEAPK